jgi:hypothetical protein
MALTSMILDNFDDGVIAPVWSGRYGTVTETGGRSRITCDTGYSALATAADYTWSDVYARLYPPALASATTECYLEMVLYSPSQALGTDVGFYINMFDGKFYCVSRTAFFDASAVGITYNSTTHAWMRILKSGANILFQTAPDGIVWTTQRTLGAPSWLSTSVDLQVVFESHRNNGTNNFAEVDNVNTLGATTPTLAAALDTSSPIYVPADITAEWEEDPPNEASNPNPDALRVLTMQASGQYTVVHSLDDALPDDVTMTNSNDASTKASVTLLGRDAIFGQSMGWRTGSASGTGTGTSIATSLPADIDWGDYSIVAVVLNSNAVGITPSSDEWALLASFSDGSTLKTWVYGRRWYSGAPALTFALNSSIAYAWVAVSAYARMANGIQVPWELGVPVSTAESGTGTAHSALSATLSRPGFIVGIFSSVGVTWTAGAGSTELREASSTMDIMVSSTDFRAEGSQVLIGTSASSISIATMIAIPLQMVDRKRMGAREYFSPFNRSSPLYGRERDTAATRIDFNVLGAGGPLPTTIHRGQMADIVLAEGGQAQMTAVSKTRLDLDRSLVLPEVWGQREGMTPDWVALWIAARGGQFAGPAPTPYTIYWNPMYGSTHAFLDADSFIPTEGPNFTYRVDYDAGGIGPDIPLPTPRPTFVTGPFQTGVFACQDDTHVESINLELYPTTEALPFLSADAQLNDQFSQANAVGRISFWIRGDDVAIAPGYLTSTGNSAQDYIFQYKLDLYDSTHTGFLGFVRLFCISNGRFWQVQMGSDSTGSQLLQFNSLGALPADGNWHFVSLAWDPANGVVKIKMDGTEVSSNYWAVNIPLNPSIWPLHDSSRVKSGTSDSDPINNILRTHLPLSDVQIEAGQPYANDFSVHYPTPAAPSLNATMRPTGLTLGGLAEVTPVTGWDTLSELARATLSAYRADETDNLNFLPLTYFGEAEQMTPTEIVDTEVNASELNVTMDPTKMRNVITVEFEEVSVSTLAVPVLTISQAMEIPRGVTTVTFTLDTPTTELFGKDLPGSDTAGHWTLWNLSDSEIDGTVPPTSIGHYMTVQTEPDATGINVGWDQVKARVMSYTSSTVTIRFTNLLLRSAYLANDGDAIPFMVIRGNAVTKATAYVTARDAGSISTRRERALSTSIPWIDNRADATTVANWLASLLARPRPELKVTVVGDPRRKPGQLVTIADSVDTQADGNWRILSVDHNVDGAEYTQDLALVRQVPVGMWDGEPGWDEESWGI